MSFKYKSPLIRSRNTSVAGTPPDQCSTTNDQTTTFGGNDVLVYDNTPLPKSVAQHWRGRGCSSSPKFLNSRPPSSSRGSPYRWTPPLRPSHTAGSSDNGWSPQRNNSFGCSTPYRPQLDRYRKQNTNNYPNKNNESDDESYFHPSMLEDPWAPLLNNSANIDE